MTSSYRSAFTASAFTVHHARAALTAVDRAVGLGGATIRQLTLRTVGGSSVADVTVAEISVVAAQRIADVIAGSAGVRNVKVEHLYGSR